MSSSNVGIELVAEQSGVSTATVSRIMNKKSGASVVTIGRVKDVAKSLGYIHKSNARTKKEAVKVKRIQFISVGFNRAVAAHSFGFMEVLHGIEDSLTKNGIELLFGQASNESERFNLRADGLILMGGGASPKLMNTFNKTPYIWALPNYQHISGLTINHDDNAVGRIAFNYLRDKGHKEISVLNSVKDHIGCAKRLRMFELYAELEGMKVRKYEAISPNGSDHSEEGVSLNMNCIKKFVSSLKDKTNKSTALFSVCDLQTFHLYNELLKAGLKPSHDIDIISCDNDRSKLEFLHPRPATIDVRFFSIGQKSVDVLLGRIQESPVVSQDEGMEILIQPELITFDG